ncbi:hypothetical protein [Polaromonas sp.]|uniref:hypothetical protein n=1 Tax=Polaromonas sp. TaxID=1869339 RepID=UPI0017B473C2|nr:hypothetical protein [Polaromonas sp.]NML84115.1 hypothetical protein [Polaromonas sp.]
MDGEASQQFSSRVKEAEVNANTLQNLKIAIRPSFSAVDVAINAHSVESQAKYL